MGILGNLFKASMDAGAAGREMLVEVSQDVEAAAEAGMSAIGDSASSLAEKAAGLAGTIYQSHMDAAQVVVDVVVDSATVTAAEILKRLPLESTADMPPEVQSLIEVRGMDEKLTSCFAELREQGGLNEVMRYLDNQPRMEEERARLQVQPDLDPGDGPAVKLSLPKLG